jgi:Fe-S cluster biogenesis protein NfuA
MVENHEGAHGLDADGDGPGAAAGGAMTGAGTAMVVDAPAGEHHHQHEGEHHHEHEGDGAVGSDGESGADMTAELVATIDAIRPALQADGGDMQLVDVDTSTGRIDIELIGACGTCPASTMTLRAGIERILMDRVPWVTEVNAVGMDPVVPGLGDIPGFEDW